MAKFTHHPVKADEKETVHLYFQLDIGASGAVSAFTGGTKLSAVKEATAGQYTLTLDQKFHKVLMVNATPVKSTATTVGQVQVLATPSTFQASFRTAPAIVIQCLDFAGAAVNPASGESFWIEVVVRNTAVGTRPGG